MEPVLIRLSRSDLGLEEHEAITRVLNDGYLAMGKEVELFENELTNFIGKGVHVACTSSGTAALHLALQACGVGLGDDVLVPSITYVASYQAISATGARPVSCDVNLSDGCLNVDDVKNKITSNTKAIMFVHYASSLNNRREIFDFARLHNLRVIEDAAHSFGGKINDVDVVGSDGDISCFSFDSIKNITCGEGGAVVSHDTGVINEVRDCRLLGVEKDSDQRFKGQRSWEFDVKSQGWRYHMSNINAAIGRAQLGKITHFVAKRRAIAAFYQHELSSLSDVQTMDNAYEKKVIAPHIFPIRIPVEHREAFRNYLHAQKIETGMHYFPNHLLTKYKSDSCPIADQFGKSVVSLPLHTLLSKEDTRRVTSVIKSFFN